MSDKTVLLWLRQDLRTRDNPALLAAAAAGRVLPVYIVDESGQDTWPMGEAGRWWLHQSLSDLNGTLHNRLWMFRGDPEVILPELAAEHGAEAVYWNRCYEPWRTARDGRLKKTLQEAGLEVTSSNGSLLWEPWEVLKADDTPYKVFTPYFTKGCRQAAEPRLPLKSPEELSLADCSQPHSRIDDLGLMPARDWYTSLDEAWQPGENGAAERLEKFLSSGLELYKKGRDFPALEAVSRLSPYLHFGEISPNQAWYRVQQEMQARGLEVQGEHFQRELGWREFSYSLLYHFPHLPRQNLQKKFDSFPWHDNPDAFHQWCRGMTGYPIIDAGMRELWQTGYMHNRVRMIVASFLVKNLLIHWHRGEDWFWDCLVDADLANNSASWQWVAGCGADAAPYFRIFNPVTQGLKFDPQGEYVRRFVPEIADLPDKYIHDPSSAPAGVLTAAGVVLGKTYPQAMVDLRESRLRALEAFKTLSGQ
ncbi:MAG: deoxyribodipyrimidine photo-lyase [Gammaproteobacteria bacterium]